jgi:hypothetical protein
MGIHWETPLSLDLDTNNERRDYKIGSVEGGTCGRGEGKWRRLSEGIWLMDLIYLYELEQWNLLQML